MVPIPKGKKKPPPPITNYDPWSICDTVEIRTREELGLPPIIWNNWVAPDKPRTPIVAVRGGSPDFDNISDPLPSEESKSSASQSAAAGADKRSVAVKVKTRPPINPAKKLKEGARAGTPPPPQGLCDELAFVDDASKNLVENLIARPPSFSAATALSTLSGIIITPKVVRAAKILSSGAGVVCEKPGL